MNDRAREQQNGLKERSEWKEQREPKGKIDRRGGIGRIDRIDWIEWKLIDLGKALRI